MCGRYVLHFDIEMIIERYDIAHEIHFEYEPNYNIAPSQRILAIIHDGKQNRAGLLQWGLIPSWAKDASIGMKMINARAESLQEKPSFRQLIARKRCVIPANGYYEWKNVGGKKQPMYIGLKNEPIFSFAGLYDTWIDSNGNKVSTCTIITTKANEVMQDIHERMPVILGRDQEGRWLNRNNQNETEILTLLKPYPSSQMIDHPVSVAVGNVKNNTPTLIEPVDSIFEQKTSDDYTLF